MSATKARVGTKKKARVVAVAESVVLVTAPDVVAVPMAVPVEMEAEAAARLDVGTLVRESRRQHVSYRQASERKDYVTAEACVAAALEARMAADAIDQAHADPEWSQDAAPHAVLVAFYEMYPTIL